MLDQFPQTSVWNVNPDLVAGRRARSPGERGEHRMSPTFVSLQSPLRRMACMVRGLAGLNTRLIGIVEVNVPQANALE